MNSGNIFIILVSFIILGALGVNSYCEYSSIKKITQAQNALNRGYPRVANQLIEHLRKNIKYNQKECDLILSIDSRLRSSGDLFLDSEKCLYGGGEKRVNPYLAISQAFEIEKDIESAKRIIFKVIEALKYDQSLFFRLAYLSFKEGKKDESGNILRNLIKRNKNDEKIILSAIQFFTQKGEWEIPYTYLKLMEQLPKTSFESNITLYGVAKKNKDEEREKKYLGLVNKVLEKLPKDQADKILDRMNKI